MALRSGPGRFLLLELEALRIGRTSFRDDDLGPPKHAPIDESVDQRYDHAVLDVAPNPSWVDANGIGHAGNDLNCEAFARRSDMPSTTFRLPTKSFRSIPSPHGNSKFGFFFAGADKLPKGLWDWRRVNPREVNTKTAVFKAITATLSQNPERFHERNRGITIVAKTLSFDDKKQEVVMELSDNELHGVVDGAHTLRAVLDAQETEDQGESASVFFKCITGIEATEIAEIAGGLNTSQQVDLKSLENLREHFDLLKLTLKGQPYADKIAYKMNENLPVDVREVLYYLAVFDCSIYSDKLHPVALFGRKEGIVRRFAEQAADKEDAGDSFKILISMAPEILRLRDLIEKKVLQRLDGRYKAGRGTRVRSESNKNNSLTFLGEKVNGRVPLGWIMPLLAAFRANVKWKKPRGSFSWIIPIETLLDTCVDDLVLGIKEIHAQENSRPEYVGRNALAWRISYDTVSRAILQQELSEARSK